jgi:lipoate-protein ligase A
VIAPLNSELFGNSVLDCYRVISEVLQQVLSKLGLPARLVPGKPRAGRINATKAVCFSAPSQYELVVDGCKVAGSAQRRHGQAFLQHGSIPIEMDLRLLGQVLRADSNVNVADSLQSVGWLNRYSRRLLEVDEVETLLADVFAEHLGIEWQGSEPSAAEHRAAEKMKTEKYANHDWNMSR